MIQGIEGKIVRLKNDNSYVGVIENSSSSKIFVRYIRFNRSLSHGCVDYTIKDFYNYWDILT